MIKTRPKRPSADVTRNKILKNALQLFMQYGFAGTSMGKLAEKANVNQTLIFHHFGCKKQLWQQVKATIIENIKATPISPNPSNLHQFLWEVIEQRLSIYATCPQLRKLILWQKLESITHKQALMGISNSPASPLTWKKPIQFLQGNNLINPQIKPELIINWLLASIDVMIDDDLLIFKKHTNNKNEYINMIVSCMEKGLAYKD